MEVGYLLVALVGWRFEGARIFDPSRTIIVHLAFCVLAEFVNSGLNLWVLGAQHKGQLPPQSTEIRLRLTVLEWSPSGVSPGRFSLSSGQSDLELT